MIVTKKQFEALHSAPFEEYDDEESLDVEPDGDGVLEVRFGRYSIGGYSRYVTPEGNVMRYDGDTDKMVDAPWEPLIGSYTTSRSVDGGRVERKFRY